MIAATPLPQRRRAALITSLTRGLGVLIDNFEGVVQLNQHQQNWITYRSTCEALRHQKYLYLANAGPSSEGSTPPSHRTEGLISQKTCQVGFGAP
jgi:hypothetical protein